MNAFLNVPLLRKAVEWVERQAELPERKRTWYQNYWRMTRSFHPGWFEEQGRDCGTVMCVAGYVCDVSGVQWDDATPDVTGDGDWVEQRARDLLGIDPVDADDLFNGGNNANDIREIAERIAGQKL